MEPLDFLKDTPNIGQALWALEDYVNKRTTFYNIEIILLAGINCKFEGSSIDHYM